jgi:hypothetical protein
MVGILRIGKSIVHSVVYTSSRSNTREMPKGIEDPPINYEQGVNGIGFLRERLRAALAATSGATAALGTSPCM